MEKGSLRAARSFLRFTTLSITVLAVIFMGGPATAQTDVVLERLRVDLWPEFDQPEILVIYRGSLPPTTPLPASLTLRIPARVGAPHAVAYLDEEGDLLEASSTTLSNGDWLEVSLETPSLDFQLEYYDELSRTGERRSYTFTWPGDYAVRELDVFLLPPAGAVDIQTEPELNPMPQETGSSSFGASLGSVAPDQEIQVTLSYNGGPAGVSQPAARQDGDGSNNGLLIAGAGAVLLTLVIGGTAWYTRRVRRRRPTAAESSGAGGRRSKRARAPRGSASATRYCTQCGHRLSAQDRFCGRCGTAAKEK